MTLREHDSRINIHDEGSTDVLGSIRDGFYDSVDSGIVRSEGSEASLFHDGGMVTSAHTVSSGTSLDAGKAAPGSDGTALPGEAQQAHGGGASGSGQQAPGAPEGDWAASLVESGPQGAPAHVPTGVPDGLGLAEKGMSAASSASGGGIDAADMDGMQSAQMAYGGTWQAGKSVHGTATQVAAAAKEGAASGGAKTAGAAKAAAVPKIEPFGAAKAAQAQALTAQKTASAVGAITKPTLASAVTPGKAAAAVGAAKAGGAIAAGAQAATGAASAGAAAAGAAASAGGLLGGAVSAVGATGGGLIAAVAGTIVAVAMTATIAVSSLGAYSTDAIGGGSGQALADVAIAEWKIRDQTVHGEKYWKHAGFDRRVAWCSCFVYWCWDEAGMTKALGEPDGRGWANSWIYWMHNDPTKGTVIKNDSSYIPKPGDIMVAGDYEALGGEDHSEHVEIAVGELENGTFRVIGGNGYGDKVHDGQYFPGQYFNYVARANWPGGSGASLKLKSGSGKGALFEGVSFKMTEDEFIKEWAPRIDKYFDTYFHGSPLTGHGKVYAKYAYRAHFDPRFLPAVAGKEQSGGLIYPGDALAGNYYGWGVYDSGIGAAASAGGSSIDAWIEYLLSDKAIFLNKPLVENTWEDIDRYWATDTSWGTAVTAFMRSI